MTSAYENYRRELGRFNAAAKMHEVCGRTEEGDEWLREYRDAMIRALGVYREGFTSPEGLFQDCSLSAAELAARKAL